jgi:hypothetical protein
LLLLLLLPIDLFDALQQTRDLICCRLLLLL